MIHGLYISYIMMTSSTFPLVRWHHRPRIPSSPYYEVPSAHPPSTPLRHPSAIPYFPRSSHFHKRRTVRRSGYWIAARKLGAQFRAGASVGVVDYDCHSSSTQQIPKRDPAHTGDHRGDFQMSLSVSSVVLSIPTATLLIHQTLFDKGATADRFRPGHETTIIVTTITIGDDPPPTTTPDSPPPPPPTSSTTSETASSATTPPPVTSSAASSTSSVPSSTFVATSTSSRPATSARSSASSTSSSARSTAGTSITSSSAPTTSDSSLPSPPTPSPSADLSSSPTPTPTPVSASSHSQIVPVLVGILVPLFLLALLALFCIRRRRRRRPQWDETRVHVPDDDEWRPASVGPRHPEHEPETHAEIPHSERQHAASPMDAPWNGSDVLLLGPTERDPSASPSPTSATASVSPSPVPPAKDSPSPSPSPAPFAWPFPDSPTSEKHTNTDDAGRPSLSPSRAPTFRTFDDHTPPTPPPHYARPLPKIPFGIAY
ncbi:hypothetical protein B0H17DRAFT_129273 [Mycena rosella]|uniref:Uncharacterized protein n=1 Tax=Mycena rosella TaxID=1033263 RepID=A0AAD7D355_MYCRO|nr:hypothetical protein B0H17DRAFT_129273 [Mycena rosella]